MTRVFARGAFNKNRTYFVDLRDIRYVYVDKEHGEYILEATMLDGRGYGERLILDRVAGSRQEALEAVKRINEEIDAVKRINEEIDATRPTVSGIAKHTGQRPGVMPDWRIKELAERGMIDPFHPEQVKEDRDFWKWREPVISYGLSSFGYDVRLSNEFKVFTPGLGTMSVIDPKDFDERALVDFTGDLCVIPPNSFVLGRTVEHFRIPDNVITVCVGKSTYARCGIIVNVTPFEPGWVGYATLEISNTAPLPAMVHANEGIAQVIFFEGLKPNTTYADRSGKYQNQEGITLAKV